MKKGIELKQHFHTCMPLFIALGDEIRLTIIEALTDEALTGRTKNNDVNKNQPDKNNDSTRKLMQLGHLLESVLSMDA